MPSSSSPEQPSGLDPSSVLCDKCRKSVLEPSQNTENVSLSGKLQQALKDWLLGPQMWPVGYLIRSPYSPLRVEQELPKREWRNAFEDLLALDSGGEMISHESRKQEKGIAADLSWERANYCINKINKWNIRDAPDLDLMQRTLDAAKSSPPHWVDPSLISWVENALNQRKETVRFRIAVAEAFKAQEETRREWSASRHKERGQWVASLITSGALRGWTSVLNDSEDGDVITLSKEGNSESSESLESSDGICISELELKEYFEDGKPLHTGTPRAPLYRVSPRPPATPEDDDQKVDHFTVHDLPQAEPIMWTKTPERPLFFGQSMAAERITLPNGKTATKVVMRNWLTNGDVEEKVMVEEPGKVLQEVEKARASISDRRFGFNVEPA